MMKSTARKLFPINWKIQSESFVSIHKQRAGKIKWKSREKERRQKGKNSEENGEKSKEKEGKRVKNKKERGEKVKKKKSEESREKSGEKGEKEKGKKSTKRMI